MIISFSGAPGSGKSTVAQMLADKLNFKKYNIGGMARELAKKHGLTLVEYLKLGETNPEIDNEIDTYQAALGKNEDNFIIESRISWYFIPQSLKIYLQVSPEEGAKRIFSNLQIKNSRNEDVNLNSFDDVLASNRKRIASDNFRYHQYYNIESLDPKNYDLYLDTTNLSPEAVFQTVYEFVENNLDKGKI